MVRHWLLSLVVEHPLSLRWLFPEVEAQGLNVKPIPYRDSEDYATGIRELVTTGMVKLKSEFPEDDVESVAGVSRVLDRFLALPKEESHQLRRLARRDERAQQPSKRVCFELTKSGGEAWEKVAAPEWGRFVYATTTYSGTDPQREAVGELLSLNRDLLIAYMGWYPEVRREQIKLATIQWETLTDKEVLYWKRLPFVHRASFQTTPAEARWNSYKEPQWFWEWWVSTCSWHKKPWELPNWPTE